MRSRHFVKPLVKASTAYFGSFSLQMKKPRHKVSSEHWALRMLRVLSSASFVNQRGCAYVLHIAATAGSAWTLPARARTRAARISASMPLKRQRSLSFTPKSVFRNCSQKTPRQVRPHPLLILFRAAQRKTLFRQAHPSPLTFAIKAWSPPKFSVTALKRFFAKFEETPTFLRFRLHSR
mgnify:CR=1 FL=1